MPDKNQECDVISNKKIYYVDAEGDFDQEILLKMIELAKKIKNNKKKINNIK